MRQCYITEKQCIVLAGRLMENASVHNRKVSSSPYHGQARGYG